MKLERYEKYKDSGIEWIGEIPEHWEVRKLKFLGNMYAGLADKKGDDFSKEKKEGFKPFIPFTNIFNNTLIDENELQYVRIRENENQNIVKKGDILFLMSSETLEDIGKTALYDGENEVFLNSFCKGLRVNKSKINSYYLNWLLQSNGYRTYFAIVGRGFTRINIKQDYVNNLIALLPSKEEQIQIADFLDKKTAQIDKAITLKEQLIERLKERRQILINDAVTKGLDKTAKMKDSGIEWIGEIPEHWGILKLKYVVKRIGDIDHYMPESVSNGKPYLMTGDIVEKASIIDFENSKKISERDFSKLSKKIKPSYGDIIFARYATIGTACYVDINKDFLVSYSCVTIKPNQNKIIGKYLYYYFKSDIFINEIHLYINSNTQGNIGIDSLYQIRIVVPIIYEQEEILKYIDYKIAKIDKAIELQQKQIEKLKEYRASLIDSVVTGKVKVANL